MHSKTYDTTKTKAGFSRLITTYGLHWKEAGLFLKKWASKKVDNVWKQVSGEVE